MPVYLEPGVYVEELSTGPVPIEGVGTNILGFVGMTERGPTRPRLVTGWTEFQRIYGGLVDPDVLGSYLPWAVRGFFDNSGQRAFIARVAPAGSTSSSANLGQNITIEALGPGSLNNRLFYRVMDATSGAADRFRLLIAYFRIDSQPSDLGNLPDFDPNTVNPEVLEDFDGLSHDSNDQDFIGSRLLGSSLVRLATGVGAPTPQGRPTQGQWSAFGGGTSGQAVTLADFEGAESTSTTPGRGLNGLKEIDEIALLCVPDEGHPDRQDIASGITRAVIQQCEELKDRFAILQYTRTVGGQQVSDIPIPQDTQYAAVYHPWVRVQNPEDGSTLFVPPGGHVAGIYSRTDEERGVHKAPANAVVRGIVTQNTADGGLPLDPPINRRQQGILNPKGINVIRDFRADQRGIRVWGARTLSSDGQWKYVNVRRLFTFLEESIEEGTQWVVFEPNAEPTWARVKRSVSNFLTSVWRDGALMGATPQEAFFVRVDETTMTKDDIDNGRLICYIGVAPVKPAEFVIFRFSQKTAEAQS